MINTTIFKRQKLITTLALITLNMSSFVEPLLNHQIVSNLDHLKNIPELTLIGTHDGSFHCDEVLAISMLSLLPKYKPSSNTYIIRTRNPELLDKCNIVVDVGAIYDPATLRFDHHQRSFVDCLNEGEFIHTKLSSAGLIYKHFGKDIIRHVLSQLHDNDNAANETSDKEAISNEFVNICYNKLYKDFMEHIDAIDNGISICSDGTEPRYHISTTLSSRIGQFNPAWNEPQTNELQNIHFGKAMIVTCQEFLSHLEIIKKSWWPARSIVQHAIDKRYEVVEDGSIIILEQACPWKEHLFEIESEQSINPKIIYALYQDIGSSWRIQSVPITPQSFESRKKLPNEWCGFRDEELSGKTGIPGGIFIHASGFIGN